MDQVTQILEKLIDRTQEGKISWHTTVDPDGFAATLDTIGVVVSSRGESSLLNPPQYAFRILNREGKTAELIETASPFRTKPSTSRVADGTQIQAMGRLFQLARRSALDVDSTLKDLVDQLDAIR